MSVRKMLFVVRKILLAMIILRYVIGQNNPACRVCDVNERTPIRSDMLPCCGRFINEKCGRTAQCLQGLTCHFPYRRAPTGVCKVAPIRSLCDIQNPKVNNNVKFQADCRILCVCVNGTYGCTGKCPRGRFFHRGSCRNPQLTNYPGRCCRHWNCDPFRYKDLNDSNLMSTGQEKVASKSNRIVPVMGLLTSLVVMVGAERGSGEVLAATAPLLWGWMAEPSPVLAVIRATEGFFRYAKEEPRCEAKSASWGDCSANCGGGVAHRSSNNECDLRTETRFCQVSSCKGLERRVLSKTNAVEPYMRHVHIRDEINIMRTDMSFTDYQRNHDLMSSFPAIHKRRHACKATVRTRGARLRLGPCVSTKVFQPRLCGGCASRDLCCKPVRSTTVQIEMRCGSLMINEDLADIHRLLMEYMVSGQDIWEPSMKAKRTAHHARHERHRFSLKKELQPYMFNETSDVLDDISPSSFLPKNNKNIHFVRMQKIAKCKCSRKYCKESDDYDIIEKLSLGQVQFIGSSETFADLPILHRVHRTAWPIGN